MADRDKTEGRDRQRGRVPMALMDTETEEEESEIDDQRRQRLQAARNAAEGLPISHGMVMEETFDLDHLDGKLSDWIKTDPAKRAIKRLFRQFLHTYRDEDSNSKRLVYIDRITAMCSANKQSLHLSYRHLATAGKNLAIGVADTPHAMLQLFDEVAKEEVLKQYPQYQDTHQDIYVRITDLPVKDKLRDLRQIHLDNLVLVSGVVTRRTAVFPQLSLVYFDCSKCGNTFGPFRQQTSKEVKPTSCPDCQSKGPFKINHERTVLRNYQKIALQESPGTVPAGRVPRVKDVILTADLIDCARPGQEISVTGVYRHSFDSQLNTKQGFPVFSTIIEANYVQSHDLEDDITLTKEDKEEIMKLSKEPQIGQKLIRSIAPSIYGLEHVKTAITLSLFGGEEKNINDKHRIRGDINVLMLGDPGTAKSQFLKYIEKTASRAVYTTGKGASAVGLTAGVHRDPITREWTLEGGALVLADRGVCMIDEFDKMNEQDRTSIHEAMEQQSISVSKAGIVTTLQARCAVIAAANPIGGRYDASRTLSENVELTSPILQRFDILCVLQDLVDPVVDEQLAKFVTLSHMKSHPEVKAGRKKLLQAESEANLATDVVPQELLKKYIAYSRKHCHPQLNDLNQDKLAKLYTELRRESERVGGVPIAVRHIESVMRMSEAHARMHLRDFVREDDVNVAIRTMLESFVNAQKFQVKRSMRRKFQKYIVFGRDHHALLMHTLKNLVKKAHLALRLNGPADSDLSDGPTEIAVKLEDLRSRARKLEIYDLKPFLQSDMFRHNFSYRSGQEEIVKVL